MCDKLKLLLDKCDIDYGQDNEVSSAKLEKVKVHKSQNNCTFIVKTESPWSASLVNMITKKLQRVYNEFNNIKIEFVIDNLNYQMVPNYFNDILDLVKDAKNTYLVFENRLMSVDNHTLIVNIYNKAELHKFEKIHNELLSWYHAIGFTDLIIKTFYEEKQQSVKKSFQVEAKESAPVTINESSDIVIGKEITKKPTSLVEINSEMRDVVVKAKTFAIDTFESPKSGFKIITLKITDGTDSIYAKFFTTDANDYANVLANVKVGNTYLIKGKVTIDKYSGELTIGISDLNKSSEAEVNDISVSKRVELHAHTKMSQMDGLVSATDLIKQAKKWGHPAIAITDHNSVQAFPEAYRSAKDIKVIYGVELTMIDDEQELVIRSNDSKLSDNTYIVFDLETTGFNPGSGDKIIEIGAVKMHQGQVIDTFNELIDPKQKIVPKITEVTGITDAMLEGKEDEKAVLKKFLDFAGNHPLVAHNAKFDMSFIDMGITKYGLKPLTNPVLCTLELSKAMHPEQMRHSLSHLVKRFDIEFQEDKHHRGLYDAEATALILDKMIKILNQKSIFTLNSIKQLIDENEIFKTGRGYHINIIAQNQQGLKNLFKIVSLANTKYLYRTPRILKSVIKAHRKGILIGSSCYQGEVFIEARRKSEEELRDIMQFYDYIEIQPPALYQHLVDSNDVASNDEIIKIINKIIKVADLALKDVVATGDVHHLKPEDRIFREVIVNQKVPGGGLHPLNKKSINKIPSYHFRSTNEMLNDFSFLPEDICQKIVVDNTVKIADMIKPIKIIQDKLYAPVFDGCNEEITTKTYTRAYQIYGNPLPDIVAERLKTELDSLINNNYATIYLTCEKLVKSSNDKGYMVGSRGSVGSSLVATMLGISEVNPLVPHYVCPKCQASIFKDEHNFPDVVSGYDLPKRKCSCGTYFNREGNDMLFAMFLGFFNDKVPDIDLNFSGEIQAEAHEEIRQLFGEDKAFRAGTIGTVAAKTAFGFAKGYAEDKGLKLRMAEIERLASGCEGVKRTTGQHPGGIVVVSKEADISDFTPYQFPADDASSPWYTTHFDYHVMEDNLLKFDILGKDDPTLLKMMADLSNTSAESIPFDDPKVYSLFKKPNALGVTSDEILCSTGTLGIPEFGTKFVVGMLEDAKPENFADLVKVSGLSHGTDVWLGNAKALIDNNILPFKDVIGCRDEIMMYLMAKGMDVKLSFDIMEIVRKGKHHKGDGKKQWLEYKKQMHDAGIPDWYINSCEKIKYMFPKAHATAYAMMALRVGWYKVYHPLIYYAAQFSIKYYDFDLETMINGYDAIKTKIIYLRDQGFDISKKDNDILGVLESALEMTARGYVFKNVDINKSDSKHFIIDGNGLIPPFRAIDGLGAIMADNIKKERDIKPFVSIDDLQKRCKISSTIIEKMKMMGILNDLPESGQLSMFDI